jgi:hypothetical protein
VTGVFPTRTYQCSKTTPIPSVALVSAISVSKKGSLSSPLVSPLRITVTGSLVPEA